MKKQDSKLDEVTEWPFVRWIESRERWQVDARTAKGGERKFFRLKGDALEWRASKLAERTGEGNAAFNATRLVPHGITIAQAITETAERHDKLKASVSVKDAVTDYTKHKKLHGASTRYLGEIKTRLGKLVEVFDDRKMSSVTKEELENFLLGLPLAKGTVRAVRLHVRMLWLWAGESERKYCEADRAKTLAGKKAVVNFKVEIFTPEELERLLGVADPSIIPAIVLGAFCGLRQSEVERIEWNAIDIAESNKEDENMLDVGADIAKTGKPRNVAIPINAVAWLRPYVNTSGLVCPKNYRNVLDRARVRAGFVPSFMGRRDAVLQSALKAAKENGVELSEWRDNGFRHSAITYRMKIQQDKGKVSTWAGNSEDMIVTHYNNVRAKVAQAKKYYSIVPAAISVNELRTAA